MLIVITEWDDELRCEMVSHGVDSETMQNFVMQPIPIRAMKDAYFSENIGHWILTETQPLKMNKKF